MGNHEERNRPHEGKETIRPHERKEISRPDKVKEEYDSNDWTPRTGFDTVAVSGVTVQQRGVRPQT